MTSRDIQNKINSRIMESLTKDNLHLNYQRIKRIDTREKINVLKRRKFLFYSVELHMVRVTIEGDCDNTWPMPTPIIKIIYNKFSYRAIPHFYYLKNNLNA